ncbi:MAG: hypothetical protein ACFFDK_12570 [Promethearchaeota archaeon]
MNNRFACEEFVKKLSFPLLPGSDGEIKAQKHIESELKALNINHYKKGLFVYTRFFMNFLLRIYSFLVGIQIIILIILLYFQLYLLVILLAIVLLITALYSREIRKKIQFKFTKIGKKRTSVNYIGKLSSENV